MPAISPPQIAKKIDNALSVRVIVICSDHKLLWRDSYKGVDRALTPDESILHKIIITINEKYFDLNLHGLKLSKSLNLIF